MGTGCLAPGIQLFLNPQGDVSPCCMRQRPLGNIADASLLALWRGSERRQLVDSLAIHDYSSGCQGCGAQVAIEGWDASYPATFGDRARSDGGADDTWPSWIDFNLSNACNLQCIQCSGELSSAIRIHREKRPPLPTVYGDRFFEDLRAFIPHLEGAHFAGGEPFLAPENERVWAMIAELKPDLPVTITTNATVWNDRVERVLDRLQVSIVCSLDAITPSTYGGIRIGADLEPVLANVERFQRATQEQGTTFSINHCLMVQNHHEFADLLLWAEERGIHVDVSVVRAPSDCSLADLPVGELRSVHDLMSGRDDEVRPQLVRNARTWATEVARIGGWADEAERRGTGPGVRRRVLVFSVDGDGPHDDGAARRDLAAFAADGVAHVLTVDLDGVIVECSPSLDAAHGPVTSRVLGRHFDAVQDLSIELFGPLVRFREVSAGPDRFDAEARYGATDVRVAMVAVRDAQGQARHGTIVVAFRPSPPD